MTTNYEQLDWSPATWALLQAGMALMVLICMSVSVLLMLRASQASRPTAVVTELPMDPVGTETASTPSGEPHPSAA